MENDINEPFLHYKEEDNNEDIEKEIANKIRGGFITKVYGILLFQIFLTSIIVYLGQISSSFQKLLITSYSLYFISIIITLVCLLLPICSPNIYQQVPMNYITLIIFTLGYSWIVAATTCLYSSTSVLVAMFLTFVTVVSLTIYAKKAEKDYTIMGGTLFVSFILIMFSLFLLIFADISIFSLFTISLTLILFSVYIMYDTQLIIGNKRRKFSEDDYILAAVTLYLDIIILFLEILSIFGKKNENN